MEKRRNFSSFPQQFQYISNFRNQITYSFVKCGWSVYFFLNSANLTCRGTDISKYFSESLGLQDNESQLHILVKNQNKQNDEDLQQKYCLGMVNNQTI